MSNNEANDESYQINLPYIYVQEFYLLPIQDVMAQCV